VGDDVAIGANAVVLIDIPSHSVAVGVPARVLPRRAKANKVTVLERTGLGVKR
jgi:serine O-acetyltransferase